MRRYIVCILSSVFFIATIPSLAFAAVDCDAALAKDTYSLSESLAVDWHLAKLVTKETYDRKKSEGGASAELFGIPLGANFSEYQSNVQKYSEARNESLSIADARTIATATLSENGLSAYRACISLALAQSLGLHLYSTHATDNSIVVHVLYRASPGGPRTLKLSWSASAGIVPRDAPTSIESDVDLPVIFSRPMAIDAALAVRSDQFGDDMVVGRQIKSEISLPPLHMVWTDAGSGSQINQFLPLAAQRRFVTIHVEGKAFGINGGAGQIWGLGTVNGGQVCGAPESTQSYNMAVRFDCEFIAPAGQASVLISIGNKNADARGVSADVTIH